MTSGTDELRRLLDERGVEWWQKKRHTCWKVSKGQEVEMWRAWEAPDGSLTLKVDYIYGLTPAQAIAATLGSCNCSDNCTNGERTGTCKLINAADDLGKGTSSCMCFECGYTALDDWWDEFKYCPNCGRKVVEPTKNDVDVEVEQ